MGVTENKGADTRRMGRSMLDSLAGILGSRFTGLARDVILASYWGGSGAAQAAFLTAFAIPNIFRQLFGEGVFTSVFVPSIAGKLEANDHEGAWRLAERIISIQILALLAVILLSFGVSAAAPHFLVQDVRPHIPLLFRILPILMPYSLLICLTASFGAILTSLRSFLLPNLNQAVFNICQIVSVFLISRFWKNDEAPALYCFCAAILVAGCLQLSLLVFASRRAGFTFHFRPAWSDPEVRQACQRFLPGTIGAGANIINQFLDQTMVTFLGTLAVSGLNYSHRLIYLPVGLFGVAMGLVCLTDMSRAASKKDTSAIATSMDFALRTVLFLSLPCMFLFGVLAEPIVKLLFFHGAYNLDAVHSCIWALLFYLPGLPAFCCMKVATTPFHANKDMKTPAKISLCCVALNFILNISLMWSLKQGGLALATSICSWTNIMTLLFLASRFLPEWHPWKSFRSALSLLGAGLLAGAAAWGTARILPGFHRLPAKFVYLLQIAVPALAGALAYLAACILCRRPEPRELFHALRHRK